MTHLTLYHIPNSRSQRIVWLLEWLALDYQSVFIDQENAETLTKVHPLGKAPILVDDQFKQTPFAESAAIIQFLFDKYGFESKHFDSISNYWFMAADATLMNYLSIYQLFNQLVTRSFITKPFFKLLKRTINQRYINPHLHSVFTLLNADLAERPYICGETLGKADFMMMHLLEFSVIAYPPIHAFKHILRYMHTVQQLDSYQQAIIKGRLNQTQLEAYWAN